MIGWLVLLAVPLVVAGVVYVFLRRASSLAGLLAVGTALVLGLVAVALPQGQSTGLEGGGQAAAEGTVSIFGRELVLEQTDRMAMALMFFAAAGVFLLAWRFAPRTLLFPIGLGLLSLLSGALLIRPVIYAALLIEIAAALSVFALQAEGKPHARGALRYLAFATMALPGLLATHWLLERYAITPDETGLLNAASVLLAVSFALLLGVVPFHTWVTSVVEGTVPLAGTFVLTVCNGAVWFLLFDFVEVYPWLGRHPQFDSIISTAGLAMVAVGGGLAPVRRRLGALIGCAALVDSGAALVALGLSNGLGVTLVFFSLLVRPFGLALLAAGLSGLQKRTGGDDGYDALEGLGWKAPWSTVALTVGALSIAGLPISAGFSWRWALSRALAPPHPASALFLLLAGVSVMVGAWRALSSLLRRPLQPKDRSVVSLDTSESWITAAVVAGVVAVCIWVGLFPQTFAPLAGHLAAAYTFFLP